MQPLAVVAAGVSVLTWASSFAVIRSTGSDFSPGALALARVALACAVLTPLAVRLRGGRSLLPKGVKLAKTAAYGVMWFAGYFIALNAAERHIDAGTAALAVNVAPILIAVGGATILREGFSSALFTGAAISVAGVGIMSRGTEQSNSGSGLYGLGLALLAAGLYAAAVLIQKTMTTEFNLFHLTWLGCAAGTAALSPFAPELWRELADAPPTAWVGAAYLGVFPTALGFCTWAYALQRLPAGRLSAVGYLVTVVGVLMSWAFLNETPTFTTLAGGLICVIGVALGQLWPRIPTARHGRSERRR